MNESCHTHHTPNKSTPSTCVPLSYVSMMTRSPASPSTALIMKRTVRVCVCACSCVCICVWGGQGEREREREREMFVHT